MPGDKEPTQRTQPKKGDPITIPVPTRGEIDDAIAKVSQPVSASRCPGTVRLFSDAAPKGAICDNDGGCLVAALHDQDRKAWVAAHDTVFVQDRDD
jgi:hypothetical protein